MHTFLESSVTFWSIVYANRKSIVLSTGRPTGRRWPVQKQWMWMSVSALIGPFCRPAPLSRPDSPASYSLKTFVSATQCFLLLLVQLCNTLLVCNLITDTYRDNVLCTLISAINPSLQHNYSELRLELLSFRKDAYKHHKCIKVVQMT